MFSTCSHNMANFGPLTAETGWQIWDTPANFNGFRVLPSLPQRRRWAKVNQILHDVWPYPELVYYIYIFGGFCPLMEFCPVQNSLYIPSLPFSCFGSVRPTARHSSSGHQPNFAAWYKEWNYGTSAEGATYIRQDGHHVGHRPIF